MTFGRSAGAQAPAPPAYDPTAPAPEFGVWKVIYANPHGAQEKRLLRARTLEEALIGASKGIEPRFMLGQVHVVYVGELPPT